MPPSSTAERKGDAVERPRTPPAPGRAARARGRPPVLGGEPVDRTVEGPVRASDAETRAAARRRYGEALDGAPAPVLLPPAESPFFGGTLVVRPVYWAYSAADGPVTVAIQASAKARLYPQVRPEPPSDRVRGVPAWFTTNEGIVSVSWIERGIAYTLDVECGAPRLAACDGYGFARTFAEELVPVGGRGVGP